MINININDSIEFGSTARRESDVPSELDWFAKSGIRPDLALIITEADNIPCDQIRPLEDVNGDNYTLTEFQHHALEFARYPEQGHLQGLVYTVLALCGEAGELANKLKKVLRDGGPVNEEVLADELSDVLWYVAAASRELNRNLGDLAIFNIKKLRQRAADKEHAIPKSTAAGQPNLKDDSLDRYLGHYKG